MQKKDCKRWWGYKHSWRKCWYGEYVEEPARINAQLYGTKKCDACGAIADGYAEAENWQPNYDNLKAFKSE